MHLRIWFQNVSVDFLKYYMRVSHVKPVTLEISNKLVEEEVYL
jgi:hypothetical protein